MRVEHFGAEPIKVTDDVLRDWPLPEPGEDKEARGRVLVIGGTAHTPGAVLLAGEAALRAGAGKLQIATADPVAAALAVAVPEALVVPMATDDHGNIDPEAAEAVHELAADADAILLGPGFSDARASADLMAQLLPLLDCPVVLDAVASAYLTRHRDGVEHLGGRAVLTVNPQELTRTLEKSDEPTGEQAIEAARRLAAETQAVVLLGGQGKVVAAPSGATWLIERGGPGLGVSGSGDVQAGVVAGLLSRGADATQAAAWGGSLHGAAGDELATRVGAVGFLAREIGPRVPGLLEHFSRSG
ncbi:MAG TPA: NAD(P)H-hydrate dehydratase [Flexivirga sp.]|uniref:NAD(P)H-hydrate dehydratase n=1 Tax=Flexivirga sp. TaxID=1962927 RepID=UPI002D0C0B22|nr:NAD(P)H-hydrate dehydratase [Flexivirga sp.]HWC21094.1 NAD(P)H-hydrate dehydratase [Flexivirga sp.]